MRAGALHIVDQYGDPYHTSAISPDYEGASQGRRMYRWGLSDSGPNTTLTESLSTLRSRSRKLARDNSLASGAIDSFVSNLVGKGITPRWQLDADPELKQEIQQLWADSTEEMDADGVTDFYGLESMVARSMIEAGEILARFRPRRPEDGLLVPMQLQLIEADHLDESFTGIWKNGNEIRMGIEFDRIGRRVAYHLWREHPGETYPLGNTNERVRIPASEIIHVGRPLRPGQIRFRPWMAPIIVRLHEFDKYQDAELVRKQAAAMFGGFITEPVDMEPPPPPITELGKKKEKKPAGPEIIALEPGTFPVLPVGKDVRFSEPADVGGNYEKWIKQELHCIARGIGITYEQLTGDLTDVSYSSIRAGMIEFRRLCFAIQQQVLTFQFCRPVVRRWLDTAILSGALTIPNYTKKRRMYYRVKWQPDGFDWVDPEKDQAAEQLAVRSGFKSRAEVLAERGRDVEVVDQEIAEDNERADRLGLVFDSDPRKTAKTGASQGAQQEKTEKDSDE